MLVNLVGTLQQQGKLEEAERLQRQALKGLQRTLGPEHPGTLLALGNLGITLVQQGKLEEAEQVERQTLEAKQRTLGAEHRGTLVSLNNLAATLQQQGKLEEAERLQRHILGARQRTLGHEHPDTLRVLARLAATLGKGKVEASWRRQSSCSGRQSSCGTPEQSAMRRTWPMLLVRHAAAGVAERAGNCVPGSACTVTWYANILHAPVAVLVAAGEGRTAQGARAAPPVKQVAFFCACLRHLPPAERGPAARPRRRTHDCV